MRGKDQLEGRQHQHQRITPAYAGKRFRFRRFDWIMKDHPRLCGEKVIIPTANSNQVGSPPPMRGKAEHHRNCSVCYRITPAYAGKRKRLRKEDLLIQDHPRLCGEKPFFWFQICRYLGSPPPMRGKVTALRMQRNSDRITPAYAGKSRGRSRFRLLSKDHPRLCGEKHVLCFSRTASPGSPPPMRGKVHAGV